MPPRPSPQWTYRTVIGGTTGGAQTLDGALRICRRALPADTALTVHTERLVAPHLWVRQAQDGHAAARQTVLDHLHRLAPAHPQEIAHLRSQPDADGEAVVVAAVRGETLADVTATMTPTDTVWVLCPLADGDDEVTIAWTPLIGAGSANRSGRDLGPAADWGLTGASTIAEFFRAVRARSAHDAAAGILVGRGREHPGGSD